MLFSLGRLSFYDPDVSFVSRLLLSILRGTRERLVFSYKVRDTLNRYGRSLHEWSGNDYLGFWFGFGFLIKMLWVRNV